MGSLIPPPTIDLPASYTSLNTTQISVSHVPASSPIPTAVILVTLNRPQNYNAFTKVMEEELVRVYSMFNVDERVRCIVLTGAGKMFCAGADLDIGFVAQRETLREAEHRDGFVHHSHFLPNLTFPPHSTPLHSTPHDPSVAC